ncbi:uncharacterized protein LOC143284350 [Babylonia areolata]|uniref:uncharacterized protein LOC143284350 n=1 Tax=Babylonia areolata TaxID=304850 RepID=UPI003FD3105A
MSIGGAPLYRCLSAPTTSSTDLTPVIVAVVVVILVLIIVGVIVGVCYYKKVYLPKKQQDGRNSKVSPDTLPNTAMSGMTADKNTRMMFTPAPPKSAVPGGRRAADAAGHAANPQSRQGSAVSMRPTVSALATYRTPSPYITDGKDIDVDSLLDFDYPHSKQALGDPDGAESGVLLEMEGSIPMYSEAGDTPEPTRMTPVNSGKR